MKIAFLMISVLWKTSRSLEPGISGREHALEPYLSYCNTEGEIWRSTGPYSGDGLKKVLVLYRHGERTPLRACKGSRYPVCIGCTWEENKEQPPKDCRVSTCVAGSLTERGYRQMQELGALLRKRYSKYTSNPLAHVHLTSSGIDRSVASMHALSLILLDEAASPNVTWRVRKGRGDSLYVRRSAAVNRGLRKQPYAKELRAACQGLDLRSPWDCSKLSDVILSRTCMERNSTLFGNNLFRENSTADDNLHSDNGGRPNKSGDLDLSGFTSGAAARYVRCHYGAWRVRTKLLEENSRALRERGVGLIESVYGFLASAVRRHPLLIFYSAHDQSIALILAIFKCRVYEIPAFASWLSLELDDSSLHVIYNGEDLKCQFSPSLRDALRRLKALRRRPKRGGKAVSTACGKRSMRPLS